MLGYSDKHVECEILIYLKKFQEGMGGHLKVSVKEQVTEDKFLLPSFGSSSNVSESASPTYAEVVKKSFVSKKTLSSSTCKSFSELTEMVQEKGSSYDTVTSKE